MAKHCVYFEGLPCVRARLLIKEEGKEGLWCVETRTSEESTDWEDKTLLSFRGLDLVEKCINEAFRK